MTKSTTKPAPKLTASEIDTKLAVAKEARPGLEARVRSAAYDVASGIVNPQAAYDELVGQLHDLDRTITLLTDARGPALENDRRLETEARNAVWKGKRESARGFLARRDACAAELELGLKSVTEIWRRLLDLNQRAYAAAPRTPPVDWNVGLIGSQPVETRIRHELWRVSGGVHDRGFYGSLNPTPATRADPDPRMRSLSAEFSHASKMVLAMLDGQVTVAAPETLVQSPAAVPHSLAYTEGGREVRSSVPSMLPVGSTPKGVVPA